MSQLLHTLLRRASITRKRPTAFKTFAIISKFKCSNSIVPVRALMPSLESDHFEGLWGCKRRKLSTKSRADLPPDQNLPNDSVAMGSNRSPSITLEPVEATLSRLLLDVADYVTRKLPAQQSREDLVLRFTGGWVRDKLLGKQSHDIDVGISTMTGFQFGTQLKKYLDNHENAERYQQELAEIDPNAAKKSISIHKIDANPEKSKHLETVTTRIFGLDVDLVNLRKEAYAEDSRNPTMEMGTPEEDALRRDATINALFYNLHTREVEDFTKHGLDDMKLKMIRTPLPPYQTFKDDPLRVLRLIRFASRLEYDIDPQSKEAMTDEDIKQALKAKISRERVGKEIEKMMKGLYILKS